jgi:hypothetical protein
LQKLLVGGGQALEGAFVLDGEMPLVPDIGKAVAAAQFGSAGLEGEELVFRVERGGRAVADERTQVKEVLLIDLAFGRCVAAPLADKLLWEHRDSLCADSRCWLRVGDLLLQQNIS